MFTEKEVEVAIAIAKSMKREDGEPMYINVRYDKEKEVLLLQPNQEIDFIQTTTSINYKLE